MVSMAKRSGFFGESVQFRLVGEDAPMWLAAAFALLGALLALAVGALIFASGETEPRGPGPARVDADAQPALAAASAAGPAKTSPVEPPSASPAVVAPAHAPQAAVATATPTAGLPDAAPASPPAPEPAVPPTACLPVISIPFDVNSARLKTAEPDQAITRLSEWLLTHPQAVLSVEGHADSTGTEPYNVLLSYSRAQAVVAWLAHSGAPEAQMSARAAGTHPPARAASKAMSNRQVILQVEGVEPCGDDGLPTQAP